MLTDNLVAYYKLDESSGNASDSAGGGLTLTNNNVSFTTGKINNSASFNGSAYLSTNSNLFPASGDFTIAFWYYANNETGQLFADWATAKRNIYIRADANTISLFRGNGSNSQSATPTTSATIANDTWTYVVFTQSGTTGSVYLNSGTPVTSNLTYTGGTDTGYTHYVGVFNQIGGAGLNDYFTGRLDEVGVWSRALSSTEVSELYNSGAGFQYPFTQTTSIKSINGLAYSSVKSVNGLAVGSIKSINSLV